MGELTLADCGAAIRWSETGDGRPLVLLPGLSMPVWPTFEGLVRDPRFAGRRLVLIDFLGSGASDHPADFEGSLASHARSVAAVLGHLGLERVDLLGHSMGGTVGIRLALDRPDLVGRLAVAEANFEPGGGMASRRVVREDRDAFVAGGFDRMLDELRDKGLDGLARGWAGADPATLWSAAHALVHLDPGFRDAFLALSIPRAFLVGERSLGNGPAPDVPDPGMLAAAGIEVGIVPEAGHAMMHDNPEGFARALLAALPVGT